MRATLTHVALTSVRDGQAVQWLEKVTDAQYNPPTRTGRPETPAGSGRPAQGDLT